MSFLESNSIRPYLVRALHEWCSENGMTPYLAVAVDRSVRVPHEYVKDDEIVLNVSFDATDHLQISNEYIEFKARFGGRVHEVVIPMYRVCAIYARENGQGLSFPVSSDASADGALDQLSMGDAVEANDKSHDHHPLKHHLDKECPVHLVTEADQTASATDDDQVPPPSKPSPPKGGRPVLRRVK